MKHENRWPKLPSDFPASGEVLAILTPRSTHIPGDERSRTCPGHGYPAHTEQSWDIQVFPSEEAWTAEITKLSKAKGFGVKEFKAVRMIFPKISTEVHVE